MIFVLFGILATTPNVSATERCQKARARYEIMANRDSLQVIGSPHRLTVVIGALDKQLEKRGWERTAAIGSFMICSQRRVAAAALTRRDLVRVTGYSNIVYRRR